MTDKKKPPSFGDHGKEFLDLFEKETQKLKEQRAEQKAKKLLQEKKEAELLESARELKKLDEEVVSETTPDEPIENERMGKYLKTLRDIDTKQKKNELAEGTVLKETDLLGGADQAVTQAQLKRATGEMFARIQTSLASLGGGGLGKIQQGVEGTPADGQLPMYDSATGDMVWASVAGVGTPYTDADALDVVLGTVDSAYVQARVDGAGLDSAAIIQLIVGTVDSDYVAARDSDLFDSGSYTTVNHNADTLVQVDSAYVQQRQLKYLDSAQITNLIDSAYVQARDSDGGFYTTADHDSDTLIQVDSAYVQSRQIKYLDSTQITNLIDSAYVAARDSDGGFYTTADHDSDTLVQVDSAYVAARLPDLYDTPNHDSDTLAQVDSAYVQTRQLVYGDLDVRGLLAGDSGVFNIMPAADSTYDLGDSNVRWRDLWLSGNTIHLGSQAIKSGTDGVYVNNKLLGFADSAYTTAQHDSDTLVQVDSAYVQIRVKSTDFVPEGVSNLYYETVRHDSDTLVQVDSAYVRSRQIRTLEELDDTQIDSATIATDDFLRWNGTDWIAAPFTVEPGLSFNGSIDATVGGDSAPKAAGGSLYVNTTSGVIAASYAGIAGDSIDSGQAIAFADSDGEWHILGSIAEASVVEVRQGNGISIDDSNPARPFVAINRTEVDTWYVDSARVEAMIDSDYVNLHSDHYLTADHDSDTLAQVDSAYVQLRVVDIVDSAKIVNIIDSYADSAFVIRHAKDEFVDVAGDTMTGNLFIDSANLEVRGGGNIKASTGYIQTNELKSVGNSNIVLKRNDERRMLWGGNNIIADRKIRYNSGYNRDSYTSNLDGDDSYTLMPKWYIDSATAGVQVKLNEENTQTSATTISGLSNAERFTFNTGNSTGGGFQIVRDGNTGLFYSWGNSIRTSQIATSDNEILNLYTGDNRYAFKSRIVQVGDSDPTVVGTSLYDSYGDSNNLWFNTDTRILSVRESDGWSSIINPESVKAIIDSGYVQHRFQPGTLIAGGRVVATGATQTWTDSDGWPSRYVKSLWGIKDIDYLTGGVYQFFFDSAVNTALVDSYSYVVQSTLDYRGDDPGGIGGSQRTLNVLRQDSNSFTLVLERGDGDNEDYGSRDDDRGIDIDGSLMNFTVTKAI